MGVSVIVPVYNSEATLPELLERLERMLEAAVGAGAFEVILVNDASRDGSWRVVSQLASQYPWLRGIDLMRNYGQHNALLCGIRIARFDKIVTLDDDLQNPPEEVPVLLAKLTEGLDVVYGKPRELHHGQWRNMASLITKAVLQGAMGAETARRIFEYYAARQPQRFFYRCDRSTAELTPLGWAGDLAAAGGKRRAGEVAGSGITPPTPNVEPVRYYARLSRPHPR